MFLPFAVLRGPSWTPSWTPSWIPLSTLVPAELFFEALEGGFQLLGEIGGLFDVFNDMGGDEGDELGAGGLLGSVSEQQPQPRDPAQEGNPVPGDALGLGNDAPDGDGLPVLDGHLSADGPDVDAGRLDARRGRRPRTAHFLLNGQGDPAPGVDSWGDVRMTPVFRF